MQACQLLGMQTAQFRDCDLASLNAAFTKRVTITKKDESKWESPDSYISRDSNNYLSLFPDDWNDHDLSPEKMRMESTKRIWKTEV